MVNIKFYYLEDENEPIIVILDETKLEAYSIDVLDNTNIQVIKYPTDKDLKGIIKDSKKSSYDGSWTDIKFILDDASTIENFILAKNRSEYIISLQNKIVKEETINNILIERFWECFENQPTKIGDKYNTIYNESVNYLKSLNNEYANKLLTISNNLTKRNYFYLILNRANADKSKINEKDFSF